MALSPDQLEALVLDLDKRTKQKLKVKDLPIKQLRAELAKEPQNPVDILLPHSIGADLLSDKAITLDAPKWIPLTLENSFANYGSSWAAASVCKDQAGVVHIKGLVKRATNTPSPVRITTLPIEYRPTDRRGFVTIGATTVFTGMRIDVLANGEMIYELPGGTEVNYCFIDPISFVQ